jgi:uncharacterized protein with ParB-like and HNH nuclease domain
MTLAKRDISTHDIHLTKFVKMLAEGKFLIPSFQRYFVWEPETIIALWDSIYHFYPIGSILYWETAVRLKIHRKLGGYVIPLNGKDNRKYRAYILDGQQRATSLLVSLRFENESIKNHESFNYCLYFDASNASFFFENELYKRKWDTNPTFLIRLREAAQWTTSFKEHFSTEMGFNANIEQNLDQLYHVMKQYRIPLIRVKGFDIKGVCDIFERINQGGKKLELLDIYVARNFTNNPTIIEEDM